MPWNSKKRRVLDIVNDIREDCSEVDEGSDLDTEAFSLDSFDTESTISSDIDNENIFNLSRRTRTKRLPSYSDESDHQNEVSADGTLWKKIKEGCTSGRPKYSFTFKENNGPTGYAKKNIVKGKVSSPFFLLINKQIIEHIILCTELEASRVLGTEWKLTKEEFCAFLAILYARGAYEARNLKMSYLWSKKWGPIFFRKTLSRNNFTNILRFIRFDKRTERSQRLQNDKFALISRVWDDFIENSRNCFIPGKDIAIDEQLFPTRTRCRFTQYMPNKPNKFGIKFWLASDVATKYVITDSLTYGKKNCNL